MSHASKRRRRGSVVQPHLVPRDCDFSLSTSSRGPTLRLLRRRTTIDAPLVNLLKARGDREWGSRLNLVQTDLPLPRILLVREGPITSRFKYFLGSRTLAGFQPRRLQRVDNSYKMPHHHNSHIGSVINSHHRSTYTYPLPHI